MASDDYYTRADIDLKVLDGHSLQYIALMICGYKDREVKSEIYAKCFQPMNEREATRKIKELNSMKALFLQVIKHEQFLNDMAEDLYKQDIRSRLINKPLLLVLLYVCIILISEDSFDDIINVLKEFRRSYLLCLFEYLFEPNTIYKIIEIAHLHFVSEYILDFIIYGFANNQNIYKKLLRGYKMSTCQQLVASDHKHYADSNLPEPPKTHDIHKNQFGQLYERPDYKPFILRKVLDSTQAQTFYERALEYYSYTSSSFRNISRDPHNEAREAIYQPIRKPHRSTVDVKKNASAILREAAAISKVEQSRTDKLLDLLSGAANYVAYENFESELQVQRYMELVKNVEKKHLLGLISFEEARLSKKRLFKENQERRKQFELEKAELLSKLSEYKKEEYKRIEKLIKKAQEIQKNAKVKQADLIKLNYRSAQAYEADKKKKLLASVKEKRIELDKKIEVIREIRALNALKKLEPKVYYIPKPMSYGSLCTMSTTELNERLKILKTDLKNELEMKKQAIAAMHNDRQMRLRETESFIADFREEEREKKETKKPVKYDVIFTPDHDLLKLRAKLENAKKANSL